MKSNNTHPYLKGIREEINNEKMNLIEGQIPKDIGGFAYVVCQMGNVNSQGLPFKKKEPDGSHNPDFQSPIMNGDGFVYKFDFSKSDEARITSKLMKTPCYFADKATGALGEATKDPQYKGFHFNNMGIARLSMQLGARNFLNTAFLPVHFETDDNPSLLVTDDMARPFKLDPKTVELGTPIGTNFDWTSSMPPKLQFPFALTETTAHPCWDPLTKEFFSFNYSKSTNTELHKNYISKFLFSKNPGLTKKLKEIAEHYEDHQSEEKAIKDIHALLDKHEQSKSPIRRFFQRVWSGLKKILGWIMNFGSSLLGFSTPDRVFLIRSMDGVHLQKWRLKNQRGKDIIINQCMHQTIITQNHLVFVDASFKFALELFFNNPFPKEPWLDEFIRKISSKTMLPFTNLWYIKRSEIDLNKETVTAYQLDEPLPYECIHFTADYDDSEGIKLYTIHNNSVCMAEWLRPYDTSFYSKKAIEEYLVSYFAICPLSVGRTGQFVIDTNTNTFASKIILREPGNLPSVKDLPTKGIDSSIGANTWGLGLLAYKNHGSPTKVVPKIKTLYYISLGAIPETLSQFVFDLYENYPWREMPIEDMLAYIKETIPQCIFSVSADTMTIKDSYVFNKNEHLSSIQYINSDNDDGEEDNGYVLLSVKTGDTLDLSGKFQSEIWLFKANSLSDGPVCKLAHPKFIFVYTLHSCWLNNDSKVVSGQQINIKEDYTSYINELFKENVEKKEKMLSFFNTYVFPNYE
jgi:carotenoid cleavage dioxygenase-like enzyme